MLCSIKAHIVGSDPELTCSSILEPTAAAARFGSFESDKVQEVVNVRGGHGGTLLR